MKGQLTSFGYLLGVLQIPVSYISQHLYVDQSLVSKWKHGKRSLSQKSTYYDQIVYFLATECRQKRTSVLNTLFSQLYPDQDASAPLYFENCISQFLTEETSYSLNIPLLQPSSTTAPRSSHNRCFSVCNGIKGRQDAIHSFLIYLNTLDTPIDCYMVDINYQEWLVQDKEYFKTWLMLIQTALDKGHRIHYVRGLSYNSPHLYFFFQQTHVLFSHSNFRRYYCINSSLDGYMYTNYIIPNNLSVLGLNQYDDSKSMYTAIFQDEFTLAQHHQMCLKAIKHAQIFKTGKSLEFIKNLQKEFYIHYSPITETYFSSMTPNFITMDKGLLLEILDTNSIHGKEREKCLIFYDIFQPALINSRHFYNLHIIADYVQQSSITCHFLSVLLGQAIIITQSQYKRHLMNLVSLLENNSNCTFSHIHTPDEKEVIFNFSICQRNHFYISFDSYLDGHVNYTYEPLIIHYTSTLYSNTWKQHCFESELRNNVQLLKSIVGLE